MTHRPHAVVRDLEGAERGARRVAIGKFDGVHRGHRALLEGCDVVITFDRHPLSLLRPERAPKRLVTLEQRAELMGALGVRQLIVLPFDRRLAALSADDFAAGVLVERLGVREVAVGEGFRFGRGMEGDVALLRTYSQFATRVTPLLCVSGEPVSSSRIRAHVAEGDLRAAAGLLGRAYSVRTQMTAGGRANTRYAAMETDVLLPPAGAYRCVVKAPSHGGRRAVATAVVDDAGSALELRLDERLPVPRGAAVDVALLSRLS